MYFLFGLLLFKMFKMLSEAHTILSNVIISISIIYDFSIALNPNKWVIALQLKMLQADVSEKCLLGGDDCRIDVWLITPPSKKGSNHADT